MRSIREKIAALAHACGLSDGDVERVRLGVSEVVTNAIVHGYGQADRPADAGQEIRVEAFHGDEELLIVIIDDGLGMAPRVGSPGLGLGLPIVASVAQRFEVMSREEGGTEVHLVFACPGGPRGTGA